MKKFLTFSILTLVLFIATACGPSAAPTAPVAPLKSPLDPLSLFDTGRVYYNGGVVQETNVTNLWRAYEQAQNTFRTGASDQIANGKNCFKNVAETEAQVATAVMSKVSQSGLINALATGGASVSGEQATTACTQLNIKLADYIVANRQNIQDKYLASFGAATKYMQYTSAFPETKIENDLLQTYGDTTVLYEALADHGIGVTDWSWLPTENLWVSHQDERLCRYYLNGEFMQNVSYDMKLKFTGHEDALARLYRSTWNPAANAGAGECRMYRYAALEYMTRDIISASTRIIIQSGQDESVFPTDTPPTPVPQLNRN